MDCAATVKAEARMNVLFLVLQYLRASCTISYRYINYPMAVFLSAFVNAVNRIWYC